MQPGVNHHYTLLFLSLLAFHLTIIQQQQQCEPRVHRSEGLMSADSGTAGEGVGGEGGSSEYEEDSGERSSD